MAVLWSLGIPITFKKKWMLLTPSPGKLVLSLLRHKPDFKLWTLQPIITVGKCSIDFRLTRLVK
ncbi:MAG: hypothetical protein EA425_07625 [Puniceicoccaceae bacterium]|nr:MAG: hypothetical protein EA425_07625 [Puniceicoccaceae bacterium]